MRAEREEEEIRGIFGCRVSGRLPQYAGPIKQNSRDQAPVETMRRSKRLAFEGRNVSVDPLCRRCTAVVGRERDSRTGNGEAAARGR